MPTLRIEYIAAADAPKGIAGASATQRVVAEDELTISGTKADSAVAVPSSATHAIITAVGGACYVDWTGNKSSGSVDPSVAPRMYIPADQSRSITSLRADGVLSCIEATIS